MNKLSNYYRSLLLFLLVLFSAGSAYGQNCKIQLVGLTKGCMPHKITVNAIPDAGKTPTAYQWNWGDGNKSANPNPDYTYTKYGTYEISLTLTYADGSTCNVKFPEKIHVYDHPVAVMDLNSCNPDLTQCYTNGLGVKNEFCFQQKSKIGASGAPIVKYVWNFGDGDTASGPSVKHSYDSSGTYSPSLTVIDSNGCTDFVQINYAIVVLPDIKTKFTVSGKEQCGVSTYTFVNGTDTAGVFIRSFVWDFGDGSPLDTTNWSPTHTYTAEGTFDVKLTVINKLGCSATFKSKAKNTKPVIEISYPDPTCWSDAKSAGINFRAKQIQDASIVWVFDDPNSGPENISFDWEPNHIFVGGPKTYNVKATIIHNICGTMDTCIKVHVSGPSAAIDMPALPPPLSNANNFFPVKPMPLSEFVKINKANNCEIQQITYSYFDKLTTPKRVVEYIYCNATVLEKTLDTVMHCLDKEPIVSKIKLKPTDSVVTYIDSVEYSKIFKKGDPYPTVKPYYPSHGQLLLPQMHDSDLYTCYLPNHTIHFTNFSVKYRLYEALDNNPLNYVDFTTPDPDFPPMIFENGYKDGCKNKTYPWASDSLEYLWSFNDPTGVKCTSTIAGIVWPGAPIPNTKPTDCDYSTLVTPYHEFKSPTAPANGCQTITLKVWDPVMQCGDEATLQLLEGPPDPWYNRSAFCAMTWEMQQFTLTTKGVPGDPKKPLKGFFMNSILQKSCTGGDYKFRLDFSEVIPSCKQQDYWLVFDSAAATKVICTYQGQKYYDYGFLGASNTKGWPVGGPKKTWTNIPWMGNYWYMPSDTGCKTIGIVIKNGDCYDTAWYHDYICFNKLVPDFDVFQMENGVPSLVGSSVGPRPYARVCQTVPFNTPAPGIPMGVDVKLAAHEKDLKRVTAFKYRIGRLQLPAGDWYYQKPFWPDTTETTPFVMTQEDSMTSVSDTFFLLRDSSVYTSTAFVPNMVMTKVYLTPSELEFLNKHDSVNLPTNDWRARRYSFCQPYITLKPVKAGSVCVESMKNIILMSDNRPDDKVFRGDGVPIHDSISFHLPYPGFYMVGSFVENLDGCAQYSSYPIIYGHLARFNIKGADSIICLGEPITLQYFVRYWTNLCPPLPNGTFPDACINGVIDNGLGAYTGVLNAWDTSNPQALRQSLLAGGKWSPKGGYRDEKIYFNYGDNNVWYAVPANLRGKQEMTPYTYTKPGVYTVTMRTDDSIGCSVFTMRKKLIKVIQLAPDFAVEPIEDTLKFCAPQQVKIVDKTTFVGSEVNVPRKFGYLHGVLDSQLVSVPAETKIIQHIQACAFRTDTFTIPAHKAWKRIIRQDTVYVDSVQQSIWYPGVNNTRIVRTNSDVLIFDYPKNGIFDVKLEVRSANVPEPCAAGIAKPNFIEVRGPTPEFFIPGDTSGCVPFTVAVKNVNAKSNSYIWHWGDGTVSSSTEFDDTVYHTYTIPGTHEITLSETAPVTNIYTGKTENCTINFPDLKNGDSMKFLVVVHPFGPISLGADKAACKGDVITITASSQNGEYKTFEWDFGDGNGTKTTKDSVTTITYNKSGVYNVKVTGTTEFNCVQHASMNITIDSVKAIFDVDTTYGRIAKFVVINKSVNAVKYVWDFGDGTTKETTDTLPVTHVYAASGQSNKEGTPDVYNYTVSLRAYSPAGCLDSTSKQVTFKRNWEHYNVFTPNGDGINDAFALKVEGETSYNLQIFNRWGEKVFESNDKNDVWNGTNKNNGSDCAAGTYFYIWKFKLIGLEERTQTGTVTIVR